jgi:hypothetical protein
MAVSTSTLADRTQRFRGSWIFTAPVLILLAIGALAAALVIAVSLPSAVSPSVAADIRSTAAAIDQHAAVMADDGQRLADHAAALTGPDRALWLATGQHMVSDAASLRAMAERLRASAAALGDEPTHSANANPLTIGGQATLLRADGQAAIDHGHLMVDQASFMATLAARPGSGITGQDVTVMSTDAERIIDAGQRTLALAARLDAGADQLRRALGR